MLDDVTSDDFVPDDGVVNTLKFGSESRVTSRDDVIRVSRFTPGVTGSPSPSDSLPSRYRCSTSLSLSSLASVWCQSALQKPLMYRLVRPSRHSESSVMVGVSSQPGWL